MKITKINKINSEGTNGSFSIYTDTDSIFYPMEPLVYAKNNSVDFTDDELIKKGLDEITTIQTLINKSYDKYAKKYHNVDTHGWQIKQELVARRGFWSGKYDKDSDEVIGVKKRYAQTIVNKEGVTKEFMDVKGMDSVRSDFPRFFRTKMNIILKSILNDMVSSEMNELVRTVKNEVLRAPLLDIMIPTGVNNIEQYSTNELGIYKKGTPAHVKAALNFNCLLDKFKSDAVPLKDGDKIIWCYLKTNEYKLETIALSRDKNPIELENFVKKYIDRNAIFDKLFLNKIQAYYDCMNWGSPQLQENPFF